MEIINRRNFLRTGLAAPAALLAAGGALKLFANPDGLPVGLQLYTVRDQLQRDFAGTLRKVAAIGYKQVEFAGFDNETMPQIKRLLDADGLVAPSGHFGYGQVSTGLPALIKQVKQLGFSYIVMPGLPSEMRGSVEAYKRASDFMNKAGRTCKRAGLQFAYHNHSHDFEIVEGKVAYNVMLKHTDPDLVQFEMDCFWVVRAGHDPVHYMNKYPGRFPLLHVKGERWHLKPSPTARTPRNAYAPVGKGVIDWKRIFKAAKRGGLKHYYVEEDLCVLPPFQAIRLSYNYLHKLTV